MIVLRLLAALVGWSLAALGAAVWAELVFQRATRAEGWFGPGATVPCNWPPLDYVPCDRRSINRARRRQARAAWLEMAR